MAMNGLTGRDLYGSEIRINWAVATGHKEDTSSMLLDLFFFLFLI